MLPMQSTAPASLRTELVSAKKAVEVLKEENAHTQAKLEKVLVVLEKERAALREVLVQAKNAVEQVKVRSPPIRVAKSRHCF